MQTMSKIHVAGLIFSLLLSSYAALAEENLPVLYGVIGNEEDKRAWIGNDIKTSRWHKEGDMIAGFKITAIDVSDGHVTLTDQEQQNLKISISGIGRSESAPPTLIAVEDLDWKWINSEENPMRAQADTIPEWAYSNWSDLSEDDIVSLKNFYRVHGWDVHVIVRSPTRISVRNIRLIDPNTPPLTPEQIAEREKNRRPVFLATPPVTTDNP